MMRVALLCRWGEGYGMGHIQRMCSLYFFLELNGCEPVIVSRDTLPADLASREFRSADTVDSSFDLVIRDMRDSSEAEIIELKKKAKVVVVDDLGEGRNKADCAVDLLPNLVHSIKKDASFPFIYGFNFSREIDTLGGSEVRKTIDFCVYAGALKDDRYEEFLRDCLPSGATAVILNGGSMSGVNIDRHALEGMSYPLPLLCSRNLVSHFGISLFEGALCGCGLYSVNPTKYHSDLCAAAKPIIEIENFGVYPEIDPQHVKNRLKEALAARTRAVDIGRIRETIRSGLELFHDRIKPFL
jgi:hypothetical protein